MTLVLGTGDTLGPYRVTGMLARWPRHILYQAVHEEKRRFVLLRQFNPEDLEALPEWMALPTTMPRGRRFDRLVQIERERFELTRRVRLPSALRAATFVDSIIDDTFYGVVSHPALPELQLSIAELGALDETRLTAFAQSFARVLSELHRHDVLYGALGPDQIFVAPGTPPQPVILGFDALYHMRGLGPPKPWPDSRPGWAPEFFNRQAHPGPAADVYSLASTLLALANGDPLQLDLEEQVERFEHAGYSERLTSAIVAGLSDDPARRPQTIEAFTQKAFGAEAEEEPIVKQERRAAPASESKPVARRAPVIAARAARAPQISMALSMPAPSEAVRLAAEALVKPVLALLAAVVGAASAGTKGFARAFWTAARVLGRWCAAIVTVVCTAFLSVARRLGAGILWVAGLPARLLLALLTAAVWVFGVVATGLSAMIRLCARLAGWILRVLRAGGSAVRRGSRALAIAIVAPIVDAKGMATGTVRRSAGAAAEMQSSLWRNAQRAGSFTRGRSAVAAAYLWTWIAGAAQRVASAESVVAPVGSIARSRAVVAAAYTCKGLGSAFQRADGTLTSLGIGAALRSLSLIAGFYAWRSAHATALLAVSSAENVSLHAERAWLKTRFRLSASWPADNAGASPIAHAIAGHAVKLAKGARRIVQSVVDSPSPAFALLVLIGVGLGGGWALMAVTQKHSISRSSQPTAARLPATVAPPLVIAMPPAQPSAPPSSSSDEPRSTVASLPASLVPPLVIATLPPQSGATPSLPKSIVRNAPAPVRGLDPEFRKRVAQLIASRHGSRLHPPRMLRAPGPTYPTTALRRGIEGWVDIVYDIDPHGIVSNVRIAGATNPQVRKIFADEVMRATSRAIYSPAMRNGQPVWTRDRTRRFVFRIAS